MSTKSRSALTGLLVCALGSASISFGEEDNLEDWLNPFPQSIDENTRGATYERWNNVSGVTVGSLLRSPRFREMPDASGLVDSLSFQGNGVEAYGVRVRGYIVPTKTGKVRLMVSSDDNSELWLSPGRDSTAIKRVAWLAGEGVYGWSKPNETGRVASQTSASMDVEAGQAYYFEAFHKQSVGKDHFELMWRYEGDAEAAVIPADVLRPWNGSAVDANDDGLADAMQAQVGLAGVSEQPDAWGDPDGDGVMNIDELASGTSPVDGGSADGFLLWETWHAMEGNDVMDLVKSARFNGPADRSVFLRGSSTPVMSTGNVGTRLSGFIVPKESGEYQLAVTSDNAAELWFSASGSWLGKERIAFNDRWRARDSWHLLPSQKSRTLHLEAGQAYYVEVLHKDIRAPGWVSLGWKKAGDNDFAEIMPEFLRSPGQLGEDSDRNFLPDDFSTANQARLEPGEEGESIRFTQNGDPDRDGLTNLVEAQLGTDPMNSSVLPDSLTREWWFNVPGQSVVRARNEGVFLKRPSMITRTEGSASEQNTTDWFASRLRGTFVAPVSGSFRFWIAGDDHCELWISSNETKFHKKKLASVAPPVWEKLDAEAWTKPKDWDAKRGQESDVIQLEAGESYFIEMLHKAGSGNDHVSVAWQYSETGSQTWSQRTELPAAAVTSFGGDADDLDDDYLPDSWELQFGLDSKDNGLKERAKQGEAGDHDGDGLNNREEFLLGTNPCSADTDGDGVGDRDEVKVYGSNPAIKDASPPVKHGDLPIIDYQAEPGKWLYTENGKLLSTSRRDSVDFSFSVPAAGIYLVELSAASVSSTGYVPPVPVIGSVDDIEIGKGEAQEGGSVFRWLTPFLQAGVHSVKIDNRNVRLGVSLEISSISIFKHEGEDADENGIPDWMENLFRLQNGIEESHLSSIVSPACIEGSERIPGSTSILKADSQIAVKKGLTGHWYANVPLDPSGNTAVTTSFENGAIREEEEVVWESTNLFEASDTIKVRKGDSLKVTAVPSGTDGSSTQARIALDGETLAEGPASEPRVIKFDQVGSFDLSAWTVSGSEALDTTVKVEVLSSEFGSGFSIAAGTSRIWRLPTVAHGVSIESDPLLSLEDVPREAGQSRRLIATTPEGPPSSPRVLARLWEGGPVIDDTSVNVYRVVGATGTRDARVVNVLPDGTKVVEFSIAIDGPIPADLSIWIDFQVADAVFADGSTRWHLTADDFDGNGVARVLVYKAPGDGVAKICHWIRPSYDDGTEAGESSAGE